MRKVLGSTPNSSNYFCFPYFFFFFAFSGIGSVGPEPEDELKLSRIPHGEKRGIQENVTLLTDVADGLMNVFDTSFCRKKISLPFSFRAFESFFCVPYIHSQARNVV